MVYYKSIWYHIIYVLIIDPVFDLVPFGEKLFFGTNSGTEDTYWLAFDVNANVQSFNGFSTYNNVTELVFFDGKVGFILFSQNFLDIFLWKNNGWSGGSCIC